MGRREGGGSEGEEEPGGLQCVYTVQQETWASENIFYFHERIGKTSVLRSVMPTHIG